VEQAFSIAAFFVAGLFFVFAGLSAAHVLAPRAPSREKQAIYECGERTVGRSWVQFDLRFYVAALFFLVFDVEVALIYPWAVVFRDMAGPALLVGLPFLAIIIVGFAYEWSTGSLDWVRSSVAQGEAETAPHERPLTPPASDPVRHPDGLDLYTLARRDPEALEEPEAMSPETAGSR